MPITISGSTGIAGVDGSASTPAVQGTDTNTGIFFPAADTIAFGEGGSEVMRIDSSGNVGIGTTSPDALLTVNTVASFGAGAVGAPSIAAKGDLNTGIYFSAADTLDFSTAGTQRGQFDSSGNFKFNSGYCSVATGYGCRAWVNFNGTGTVAIRGSGNVTSITDNGTGDYTVNFTSAMPDANYSISGATSRTNYCFVINDATAPAVGSVRIGIYDASTAALTDRAYVCVNIHR